MAAQPAGQRPDTQRVLGQEEAMAQALLELIDIQGEKSRTLSDLNDDEVGILTLLQTMHNTIDVKEIGDFVDLYCKFKVSRSRLGRREIINAISFGGAGMDDKRRKGSIKDLFAGMR
jgi:hypothetical protein